jgi:hypothetical protein
MRVGITAAARTWPTHWHREGSQLMIDNMPAVAVETVEFVAKFEEFQHAEIVALGADFTGPASVCLVSAGHSTRIPNTT